MDSQGLVAVYSPSCERMLTGFSCGGQVDEQGVARVVLWQDGMCVYMWGVGYVVCGLCQHGIVNME